MNWIFHILSSVSTKALVTFGNLHWVSSVMSLAWGLRCCYLSIKVPSFCPELRPKNNSFFQGHWHLCVVSKFFMKYLAYVLRAIWDSILGKESHFLEGQWLSGSLLMFTCRASLCQLKKFKFKKSVCWNQVMLLPPSWPSQQSRFNWRRTGNKYYEICLW